MISRILSIAALDSSGGAGMNQDIRVAALFQRSIYCCPTGYTIQSSQGVEAIHPLSPPFFQKQLSRILDEYNPLYIKIGALCAPSQISILKEILSEYKCLNILIDPILKPTKGISFIRNPKLYQELLKIAEFISPNWAELAEISGRPIHNFAMSLSAAKLLAQRYKINILLTGGHANCDPIPETYISEDHTKTHYLPKKYWHYTHGTGCALAMAFLCYLENGYSAEKAFCAASHWVSDFFDKLNDHS